MNFRETILKGCFVIETNPSIDNRGFFERVFCKEEFSRLNFKPEIVQINHSYTKLKGSVRGLHFQNPPYIESKIIKCIKGSVYDIIVDIRKDSNTFLQWISLELSASNNKMIYIPDGFAHGFQTLMDNTELLYFHTNFYNKEAEGALNVLDEKLVIKLPLEISEISEKDRHHKFIDETFQGITL
jgi:dTDP-4-dehydrorhamnose 3,5-epimerase